VLLSLRDITKNYTNGDIVTPVLRGISLDIAAGEFVALMGPSGSGKSTLMHILGLLDQPTSGSYFLDGFDANALTDDASAKMRVQQAGFVFQAFHLLPRQTALQNVMLPLLYAGSKVADRQALATQALVAVGLSDRLNFLPNQLSGGQKQRVAIARALVNNPSVIFADEPTGNLDSVASAQVLELLRSLNRAGKTIVMVTHEADAGAYASRIIRLKDGLLV
jgi:putative ABC transport system ATP-binding protein